MEIIFQKGRFLKTYRFFSFQTEELSAEQKAGKII